MNEAANDAPGGAKLDILFLQTGLFAEKEQMLKAAHTLDGLKIQTIDLQPEQMDGTDWDNVITAVLSAGKVITL